MKKVKIINHIPLDLKAQADAEYDMDDMYMSLNLKLCKHYSQTLDMDFYEYVARCINHEFLHHILNTEQNEQTTCDLDNIAEKYKEYWLW